jgi:DNA-directed RNA polymerase subunit RPC12/RpoP
MSLTPSDDESSRVISVPVEVDDDGFLRRECPQCEREFKWLNSESAEQESEPVQPGGYHCPYCNHQAEEGWLTKPQAEYVTAYALGQISDDIFGPLQDSVDKLNQSGGILSASLDASTPTPVKPSEPNDMRRVEFACHPREPVKVLEAWTDAVHCLICGSPARRAP